MITPLDFGLWVRYFEVGILLIISLFVSYILAKFVGRLVKIIVDYTNVDRWFQAKGMENALYGVKFSEVVMFTTKLLVFVSLLQLMTFVNIRELQLVLTLLSLYGYLFVLIIIAVVTGLLFGEVLGTVIRKSNIKKKELLINDIKLGIAGLFVIGMLQFTTLTTLINIDVSGLEIAYTIFVAIIFLPLLLAYGVKEYKEYIEE